MSQEIGFVWCRKCNTGVDTRGHECQPLDLGSILCGLAFEHTRDKRDHDSHAYGPPVLEWFPPCDAGECIFCDADHAYSRDHAR